MDWYGFDIHFWHTLLTYLWHTPLIYFTHPPTPPGKYTGIDFIKFETLGIDVQYFGELMMMSGLVLNDDVKWVSFHSSYDFGYLLKTLTCKELPMEENEFMELLHTYFPRYTLPQCFFLSASYSMRHSDCIRSHEYTHKSIRIPSQHTYSQYILPEPNPNITLLQSCLSLL